jgi:hypothetical protein
MRRSLLIAITLFAGIVNTPGQTLVDLRTQTKNVDFSSALSTKPFRAGASLPLTCNVGEAFLNLGALPGQNLYICTVANTWTVQAPAALPSLSGNAGKVLSNDGTNLQWRGLGGDLSGTPDAAVVKQIQGRPVNPLAPLQGQLLRWDGVGNEWSPSTETVSSIFGRTGSVVAQAGDYTFPQIGGTLSLAQGGTGATSAAGALASIGAAPVVHTHVLTDLVGITGKQGTTGTFQMFGGGTVNTNDCARFDANGNLISAGMPCGPTPNYGQSFTSATSVTLTHNLNSSDLLVQCYDTSQTAIGFNSFTASTANSATVTFVNPQSGRCVVSASSGSSSGGTVTNLSGALTADQPVFGNSGADLKVGTKTGTGDQVVVSQSPVITSPYIADFTNMPHNHSAASAGGQLGIGAIQATALSGNGTKVATTTGTLTSGDCARIDAYGNFIDAGAPCGAGSGSVVTGLGLAGAGTAASPLMVDTTAVPTRLTGTNSLTWASFAQSTCQELTITLTGAVTGDEVMLGPPPTIDQGFQWGAYVSSANTVTVRMCKITSGSATPVSNGLSWRATIIKAL